MKRQKSDLPPPQTKKTAVLTPGVRILTAPSDPD